MMTMIIVMMMDCCYYVLLLLPLRRKVLLGESNDAAVAHLRRESRRVPPPADIPEKVPGRGKDREGNNADGSTTVVHVMGRQCFGVSCRRHMLVLLPCCYGSKRHRGILFQPCAQQFKAGMTVHSSHGAPVTAATASAGVMVLLSEGGAASTTIIIIAVVVVATVTAHGLINIGGHGWLLLLVTLKRKAVGMKGIEDRTFILIVLRADTHAVVGIGLGLGLGVSISSSRGNINVNIINKRAVNATGSQGRNDPDAVAKKGGKGAFLQKVEAVVLLQHQHRRRQR